MEYTIWIIWFFKLEYTIWIIWLIVLCTCRIFYKIINYRRTPCSSVIVCIPTMLTESHGSSRQRYGFPRNLHGVYKDHPGWSHLPGPTRTTTDVLNFPKRPCWHPGSPQITSDVPGQTRTTTDLHGSYMVHMPDHPGCAPCWSGTYMGLGLNHYISRWSFTMVTFVE